MNEQNPAVLGLGMNEIDDNSDVDGVGNNCGNYSLPEMDCDYQMKPTHFVDNWVRGEQKKW